MRSLSTLVATACSVFCFAAVAAAQDVSFGVSQDLSTLATSQPPAELRVASQPAVPSLFTAPEAATQFTVPTEGAMTAPAAPGSGFTVEISGLPDAAMTVTDQPAFSVAEAGGGSFTTADGAPGFAPAGVAPPLGFDTSTAATAAFAPDASLKPTIQLGQ